MILGICIFLHYVGKIKAFKGFFGDSDSKEFACNVGNPDSIPFFGKIPWRREWQSTPVFLPEEVHGQRILVGYSPWGHKELDMT